VPLKLKGKREAKDEMKKKCLNQRKINKIGGKSNFLRAMFEEEEKYYPDISNYAC